MPRKDVVKKMWEIVKERNLQVKHCIELQVKHCIELKFYVCNIHVSSRPQFRPPNLKTLS